MIHADSAESNVLESSEFVSSILYGTFERHVREVTVFNVGPGLDELLIFDALLQRIRKAGYSGERETVDEVKNDEDCGCSKMAWSRYSSHQFMKLETI